MKMHLLFMSLLLMGASAAGQERPNVVLVLIDDMGYSDLGSFGSEIETPNMDRIGAEGVRFTQFYNSARCCPSRASLLTGLYPSQAGIPNMGGKLVGNCVTLAEVLGEAGYQTYAVGKWHVGHQPTQRGFDEFYGYTRGHSQNQWSPRAYVRLPKDRTPEVQVAKEDFYATDVFTDYAIEFLGQAEKSEDPFFLYLAHSSPHFPIQAPKASIDRYYDRYLQGWDVLRQKRFERQKSLGLADETWVLTERSVVPVDNVAEFSGEQNPAWESLPDVRQKDLARRMATYAAMIHHVDQGIGRVTEKLRAMGELENTLFILTSDNGACYEWDPFGFDGRSRNRVKILYQGDELAKFGQDGTHASVGSAWSMLSNTPFRMYKHFTHEGGVCSPMLLSWPNGLNPSNGAHPSESSGEAGRWVRSPSHIKDIMPTICEATGARYPQTYRGQSIQPAEGSSLLAAAKGDAVANRAFGIQHQGARAWRDGDWKIVYGKRMPTKPVWELYNLAEDRSEDHDLAGQFPERLEQMVQAYDSWFARTRRK